MSRRTQITLTDEQYALLHEESARSGVSVAEQIRHAIDVTYPRAKRRRVAGFEVNVSMRKGIDPATIARQLNVRGRGMHFGSRRGPVTEAS